MRLSNIANFKTADEFVVHKVNKFAKSDHSFLSLFSFMFSERDNILYEESDGYKIKKTTYGQAYDSILNRAEGLKYKLKELPKNSIVGIYMKNGLEWIEAFWSIILCGYCPLLINLRLDEASIEQALKSANVSAVLSDERQYSVNTIMFSEIPKTHENISLDTCGEAFFVMSSGTSFHVKLCAYTSEQLYYQICDSAKIIRGCKKIKEHYQGQLKLLTFLPFYHIFGLVAVYIWFAFFSRTFVALNDYAPQTIVNTIRRHKVTHIFAVPMFWEKVYEEARHTIRSRGEKVEKKFEKGIKIYSGIKSRNLRNLFSKKAFKEVRENLFGESVKFCITGGSGISPEAFAFFNAIGYHLANGYGMTEAGITSVELSLDDKICNTLSVGKPFSSLEYNLSKEGELLVRGKSMSKYVLCNGERIYTNGDWYNTHDLAEFKGGRYYILGRTDDIVIGCGGENLNPNLIEPLFIGNGVKGACLIAGHSGENVQPVLILSVSAFTSAQKLAEIKGQVGEILAEHHLDKQISRLLFVSDSLIAKDDFKLNRAKIAKLYSECAFTIVQPKEGDEDDGCSYELKQKIKEYFAVALNMQADEIAYTADFFLDYGGNSLDYFAMISKIREEFNVSFPTGGELNMNTVKGICAFIMENA
jgi:acyl carrier protein